MLYLASLGSDGKYPGNIKRDLLKRMRIEKNFVPEPFEIKNVPMLDTRKAKPVVIFKSLWVFLGQDWLASLWNGNKQEFHRRFGVAGVPDYWEQINPQDPRLEEHPLLATPEYGTKCMPGRVHGDKVPYGKAKNASADVFSWSIQTAQGDCWDTIQPWHALPEKIKARKGLHGHDTEEFVDKWKMWDMFAMTKGSFLTHDADGIPWESSPYAYRGRKTGAICGGYFVGWMQVAPDHEYLCNVLKHPHWGKLRPCKLCSCDDRTPGNQFSDFSILSSWIANLTTRNGWLSDLPDHPLWRKHILLGLTIFSLCVDILHCLDKGVLTYYMGSAIWTLVHESGLDGSFHKRVEIIWEFLVDAYNELRTPSSERTTMHMLFDVFGRQTGPIPSTFPTFSDKAAINRHLLPALRIVCHRVNTSQHLHKEEYTLRADGLDSLCSFYDVIYAHGHFMPQEAAEQAFLHAHTFLLQQNALAQLYTHGVLIDGVVRSCQHYHITFKSHMFWHMARSCRYFNPRAGWTYRDESYMGKIAQMVRANVQGGGALGVSKPWAHNYRNLIYFSYVKKWMSFRFDANS